MLSGYRFFGHVKTSQGGHALTNKLLVKFFSDKSNWLLESGEILEKNQLPRFIKNSLSQYLGKQNFT